MESVNNSETSDGGEKVVIVGDASVGKTSLLLRYINNTFANDIKPTIGCDHYDKTVNVHGGDVKLSIWDTAGQDRFRGLATSYYKKARCVIIVFDITKKSTYDKIDFWRDEIVNYADADVSIVLVGNKLDLQDKRVVLKDDAMNYVKKNKFNFYAETSALENHENKIEELFKAIAEIIYERQQKDNLTSKTTARNDKNARGKEVSLAEGNKDVQSDGCKC